MKQLIILAILIVLLSILAGCAQVAQETGAAASAATPVPYWTHWVWSSERDARGDERYGHHREWQIFVDEADTVYELEILTLEESGNQTIIVGFFKTE